MFSDILGAGRFARIGIPFPETLAGVVGFTETLCGLLIIIGLLTRLAALPLIGVLVVALLTTKVPILLGHDLWIFHLAGDIKRHGFWSMMHESRTDLTMLLGALYLLLVGGGRWSIDARLKRERR